jgi:hypothetical protein
MDKSAGEAIERIRIREVAAIFHSYKAIEAAVEDLLLAGFDRADMDRLADLDEVYRRLGPVSIAHEELADVAQAPRRPVILHEDIWSTAALVVGVLASVSAVIATLVVVASGGRTVAAVTAAVLAALAAGSIGALVMVRILRPPRSRALEPHMTARGVVLWVRVISPYREDKARQILRQHGGEAIRVHEIEVEKHLEEIPLSSLRPDPWLGDERLGQL